MKNVTFSAQRVNPFSTCARCGAEDHAESLHEGLCAGCDAEVRRGMKIGEEWLKKLERDNASLLRALVDGLNALQMARENVVSIAGDDCEEAQALAESICNIKKTIARVKTCGK